MLFIRSNTLRNSLQRYFEIILIKAKITKQNNLYKHRSDLGIPNSIPYQILMIKQQKSVENNSRFFSFGRLVFGLGIK